MGVSPSLLLSLIQPTGATLQRGIRLVNSRGTGRGCSAAGGVGEEQSSRRLNGDGRMADDDARVHHHAEKPV